MTTDLAPGVAARAHRATDLLHSLVYFVPEADEEYAAIGIADDRMAYFASRSAAMGPVSAAVTTATFYNFNPELVATHIPRAWQLSEPAAILAARLRAADRGLRRLLGEEALASGELVELAGLARDAASDLPPEGRVLFAAHAGLGWPRDPHLVLWHAATLLREFRGDGHLAALLEADLSGIEAIVTHVATGRGFTETAARALRGWSREEWAEAVQRLRERGTLDGAGGLTDTGAAVRQAVEARTDRLDSAAWQQLGEDRTARLIELGKQFTRIVVANGAFPTDLFAVPTG